MGQFTGCLAHHSKTFPNISINPYYSLQQHFIWALSERLKKACLDTQEIKAAQIFLRTSET